MAKESEHRCQQRPSISLQTSLEGAHHNQNTYTAEEPQALLRPSGSALNATGLPENEQMGIHFDPFLGEDLDWGGLDEFDKIMDTLNAPRSDTTPDQAETNVSIQSMKLPESDAFLMPALFALYDPSSNSKVEAKKMHPHRSCSGSVWTAAFSRTERSLDPNLYVDGTKVDKTEHEITPIASSHVPPPAWDFAQEMSLPG